MMWISLNVPDSQELLEGYSRAATSGSLTSDIPLLPSLVAASEEHLSEIPFPASSLHQVWNFIIPTKMLSVGFSQGLKS